MTVIESLFAHGLGEYPILYQGINRIYLGNIIYDKGRIFFKDRDILKESNIISDSHLWPEYLLGMVCYREIHRWRSLTYLGLDHCLLEDIEPIHRNRLAEIRNENSERLSDFIGSIYRAYRLLLENGFLPVILLHQLKAKNGEPGICICDLQSVKSTPAINESVKRFIQNAIDKQLAVSLEDIRIPNDE